MGNVYSGPQVAQFNPAQLDSFRNMIDFANSSKIPGQMEQYGSGAVKGGSSAMLAALRGLSNYKPTGGVESNIKQAGLYADNPYIDGQIDASMQDATRYASEEMLPSLARRAAAGGNVNANTTAIREGVIARGLADQAGDVSSQMRGSAYNTGLGVAESGRQFNNTSRLSALNSAGSLGLGSFGAGIGALGGSLQAQAGLFDMANMGGAGLRAADQAGIDNARLTSEYGSNRMSDMLRQYMGIVSGNYGGTSTGTSTQQQYASPYSVAGGLMGGFGSLFGGMSPFGMYGAFR